MKSIKLFLVVLVIGLVIGCSSQAPQQKPSSQPSTEKAPASNTDAAIRALVDGANKEGELLLYSPTSLGKEGLDDLGKAFREKYNLNVNIVNTFAGSMVRDVAKVVTEINTGSAPTWDVMLLTDAHYATFASNGVLEKIDWAKLAGVDPKAVAYDGGAVTFVTQFVAPAYNTKLVKPEDLPKTWDDLLNPKWKDRIGIPNSTHHWARLAQVWGEDKAEKYMESMAKQNPKLGTIAEIYTALQLGEVLISGTIVDGYIAQAKRTGAPIDFVPGIQPVITTQYMSGELKNARHPNAAKLFTIFIGQLETEELWQKYLDESSMFRQGSPAWKKTQGQQVVVLDPKFALEKLDDLSTKYGKIVGYR